MTLGKRLEQARSLVPGLSAKEVDRLAGLGEGHTRQIETGTKGNPGIKTLAAAARVLGVSLDWLDRGGKTPSAEEVQRSVDTARRRKGAKS